MQHANQVACELPVNITSSVRHSGFSPSGSVTASRFPAVCLQSKVVCLQSSPGAAKRESPRNAYAVTCGTFVMVAPEGGVGKEREAQTRPDLVRTHFRVARPLPP